MTISDKTIIRKMLMNGGQFEDDPPCVLIYQYRSSLAKTSLFACFLSPEHDDMATSPYVRDVICLMANGMLTNAGRVWLEMPDNN